LDRVTRAEGLALTYYSAEEGPRREQSLLELVIREDGGLRLICGRGTDTFHGGGFPRPDRPPMAVIAVLVLGLTHFVVALAGRLADEYTGYQGQWQVGIRMDRLRGAVPLDLLQDLLSLAGNPYSREEYEKVTSHRPRYCSLSTPILAPDGGDRRARPGTAPASCRAAGPGSAGRWRRAAGGTPPTGPGELRSVSRASAARRGRTGRACPGPGVRAAARP